VNTLPSDEVSISSFVRTFTTVPEFTVSIARETRCASAPVANDSVQTITINKTPNGLFAKPDLVFINPSFIRP
jgi:hypothetical protein